MDKQIALLLIQDGVVNGAVYALLALATVLVFAVTRVLFIPQGEFVTYGALSFAALQLGQTPGIVWLVGALGVVVAVLECVAAARSRRLSRIPRVLGVYVVVPAALVALTVWLAPQKPPLLVQLALAVALVAVLGPMVYRIAFQPLVNASVLVLMIVAVAVHFTLQGLGLLFFGAEGYRASPFVDFELPLGPLVVSGQSLLVVGAAGLMMLSLYLLFSRTLHGKALRATAVNRVGGRLVGISPTASGTVAFFLAALMGAVSGVLIVAFTTVYYDSGFIIGLKAFVGAVVGALVSYPVAVAGAVFVGLVESFGSFWQSAYKDSIVFALLVPVLLWLSLRHHTVEEEEEE